MATDEMEGERGADEGEESESLESSEESSLAEEGEYQEEEQEEESSEGEDETEEGEGSTDRDDMIAIIDKWMPQPDGTSLSNPYVPDGESQDLLAKAGWTHALAQSQVGKAHPATSCGDVLRVLQQLWGSADPLGFDADERAGDAYVRYDGTNQPQPGDIFVLYFPTGYNVAGDAPRGMRAHVGMVYDCQSDDYGNLSWRTAEGGQGVLPNQLAKVSDWVDLNVIDGNLTLHVLMHGSTYVDFIVDGWVNLSQVVRLPPEYQE